MYYEDRGSHGCAFGILWAEHEGWEESHVGCGLQGVDLHFVVGKILPRHPLDGSTQCRIEAFNMVRRREQEAALSESYATSFNPFRPS